MIARIELSDIKNSIDGMRVLFDKGVSIHLPQKLEDLDVKKLTKDTEIFHKIVREHPDKVSSLINNAFQGNMKAARDMAKELGFTEAQFSEKGGGYWVLIILIIIILFLDCDTAE